MSSGRIYLQRIDKTSVPSKSNYVVFYLRAFFLETFGSNKKILQNKVCVIVSTYVREICQTILKIISSKKTYQNLCSNKSTFWLY
jgi:hypothetical protein